MSRGLGSSPARLPTADLASAFGPPDRAAGLAGKLAPAPGPAGPPPAAPESAPQPNKSASRPPEARAARGRPGPAAVPRSETAEDPIQPVIVYLSASLRDRVRERVASTRVTYTELTLEAIDATHPRLGDILAERRPKARESSLFRGPSRPRRQHHDEPQVQVSLRPARRDLEVIDRLVVELGASSRSALIATALTAYLNQPSP